ncbi:MAG: NifU family protein, partial [Flavobacterium sp.]
ENGGTVLDETLIEVATKNDITKDEAFDKLDVTSQQIINILEEYVKPAVAADGGNIAFDSYNENDKTVKVILQGACSGCPSSTFTLKSGIENMLKSMLNDEAIKVEAINA